MTNEKFSQLYNQNHEALMNFAKKLASSTSLAEDLVQETAVKAFKAKDSFRPGSSFKSWTFTILKNTFISQYRKMKRRGVVSKPVEELAYMLGDQRVERNSAVSKMRLDDIKACIDELSYKSRMPFLMHIKGYQYNEISESLDIPIGTVKSRINYARQKLKGILIRKEIVQAA